MRLVRLFGATFGLSLRRTLTHRANLAFDLGLSLFGVVAVVATMLAIFEHTTDLAGWSRAQATVLLGIFTIVGGLRGALIDPNLATFVGSIRDGTLDEALLKPAPSWFTTTCREHQPLALGQCLAGMGITWVGVLGLQRAPGPVEVLACVFLTVLAVATTWSWSLIIASMGFFAGRFELAPLTASLWEIGRYPATVYSQPVRFVVTYAFPIAGMITFPASTLTHEQVWGSLASGLALTAGAVGLAAFVFRRGLAHYTGATS